MMARSVEAVSSPAPRSVWEQGTEMQSETEKRKAERREAWEVLAALLVALSVALLAASLALAPGLVAEWWEREFPEEPASSPAPEP